MKIIFYSEQCEYSKKLLAYLEKNNIKNLFKLVNIDKTDVPDKIDVVPSIIDTELNQPMKGKKAFEYLLNLKYFNNPTNNIDYIKELHVNPNIPEDDKAVKSKTFNLELNSTNTNKVSTETILNDLFKNVTIEQESESDARNFHESNSSKSTEQSSQEMMARRNIQDSKFALLMKMKRK